MWFMNTLILFKGRPCFVMDKHHLLRWERSPVSRFRPRVKDVRSDIEQSEMRVGTLFCQHQPVPSSMGTLFLFCIACRIASLIVADNRSHKRVTRRQNDDWTLTTKKRPAD